MNEIPPPINDDIHPFVGLATYDKRALVDSTNAVFVASTRRNGWRAHHGSSLLTSTFNQLLIDAKNLNATHFALLHADVVPEDWWVDKLIAEMEEVNRIQAQTGIGRKCVVMSAVIAIKDSRGLTSTGIANPDDRWHPQFRLTLRELHADIPETFGARHILDFEARALLVNTGCMVMDLRSSIFDVFAFNIDDDIILNPTTGKYEAVVEPEDWAMSRWVHDQGGSCFATRKVRVDHHGDYNYPSYHPWGKYTKDQDAYHLTGHQ